MAEKIDETDEGYYERHGDVVEWVWKSGHEPKEYGAVMVVAPETPKPRPKAKDEPEPAPAKKATGQKKATTKAKGK